MFQVNTEMAMKITLKSLPLLSVKTSLQQWIKYLHCYDVATGKSVRAS